MQESLWEQATESDWPDKERRQWYRERPADREYYRIQRELLRDGLTRKAKLTQLPPHHNSEPTLWAIGFEGKSPLRLAEAEHSPLDVSLAVVAFVGGLKRSRRVQSRVGQRCLADGLRGVGVIVEIEVTGSVDAGLPVREVQGEGLALLNVPQDLTKGGLDAEASASPFLHSFLVADVQRPSLAIVAGGAGPLHAPRVGHGVPLEGELAGGAAGELVEVQCRLPLHAPLLLQVSLLLLGELVVEALPAAPREFTRPSFLPDSDDGGTDPGQALRSPSPRLWEAGSAKAASKRRRR